MKTLLLVLCLIISSLAMAAKPQARKVSSSTYFVCTIEREGADYRAFKREYHFPFPTEKGEEYEVKGSLRWNNFTIAFTSKGLVTIKISEMAKNGVISAEKTHQMAKDPASDSFKVQVDLKGDDAVTPYHVQCFPE